MLDITEQEIKDRLAFDNPWWDEGGIPASIRKWPRRSYFDGLLNLVSRKNINRAVVLMGPRRVGKTILLTQVLQALIDDGVAPQRICYVSVDTPVYTGIALEKLLTLFMELHGHGRNDRIFMIYDEIQYHADWERHLKSLVDSFPNFRFVASGSAAAALKLKSTESGAGRFTEFLLPPLNFVEFLRFKNLETDAYSFRSRIDDLNSEFIDYINFGGFPEAVLNLEVAAAMDRFVANDIIDKVLLRDIPSLYGINDAQELKRFFTVLAYNSGMEVSFEGLSKASGVAKNTIRKYLDYLEAAFLIHRLHRIDQRARRFKRVTHFKVYLTNPCIRAALFGPVTADSDAMGSMAETALISQLAPTMAASAIHYARWRDGEVDLVIIDPGTQKISRVEEIKWSDRAVDQPRKELHALIDFCKENAISSAQALVKSRFYDTIIDGIAIKYAPVSIYCILIATVFTDQKLKRGVNPQTHKPWLDNGEL